MRRNRPSRAKEERLFTARRALFMVEHPGCERCGQRATELHHGRGRVGRDLLIEAEWHALCHDCHVWVGDQPLAAITAGLSASRTGVRP